MYQAGTDLSFGHSIFYKGIFVSACGGSYSGENGTTLNVYNVNANMNGWGAFATFYGNNQSARTTTAYIYVSSAVQSAPRQQQTYTNYNNYNYGLTDEEQLALGLLILAAAEEEYYGYNDWGYNDWDYSYYVEPDYSDYWGGGYDDWGYGWDDYGWGW